jgi:uncharacterized protein
MFGSNNEIAPRKRKLIYIHNNRFKYIGLRILICCVCYHINKMISLYPIFTKLGLEHAQEIKSITKNFKPYSDFNFMSLFCWNTHSNTGVSLLNDNLVIRFPDYVTSRLIISILGKSNLDVSLTKLLADYSELNLVPEQVIEGIALPKMFNISEDRDSHDYVYSTHMLATLPGASYKKKRNKLNNFEKSLQGKISCKIYSKPDAALAKSLLELFEIWAQRSSQVEEEIASERKAFGNFVNNSASFDILILAVYIGDEIIAFSIMEQVNKDYAIVHFEKALKVHDQIYTYIANKSAQVLLEAGISFINWEQDLGISGLRMSKESYGPHQFLKKYHVTTK